ncbi:tetratricopeptide repeat protein [Maribacter litoralis]|uniref:tetratricopeptide repeat protein n=1 Tax=Maribacter litoralis TaxID=2059726 RepID=UPI003D2D48AC
MIKKWKWKKWLFITTTSFLGVVIILAIVFNQLAYDLLIGVGSMDLYYGNNERGNKIMSYALSKKQKPSENTYHAISVQNTKNGNYNIAIPALEKAYKINPKEVGAYYGWVLLYYYHDYEKSLDILNVYDNSTPNFSDYPMGECIHYLKALAYMQINNYEKAIKEFDLSINNELKEHNEDWVDYQILLNKGISLYHLEKYKEAIKEFKRTLKNYDKCPEAFYYIGLSNFKLGFNELACKNLRKANTLIYQGYKSSDAYVELFHEIYKQDVENEIFKNCIN